MSKKQYHGSLASQQIGEARDKARYYRAVAVRAAQHLTSAANDLLTGFEDYEGEEGQFYLEAYRQAVEHSKNVNACINDIDHGREFNLE